MWNAYDIECTYARTRLFSNAFNDNTYFHSFLHSFICVDSAVDIIRLSIANFYALSLSIRIWFLRLQLGDNSASTSVNIIYAFHFMQFSSNTGSSLLFIALNSAARKKNQNKFKTMKWQAYKYSIVNRDEDDDDNGNSEWNQKIDLPKSHSTLHCNWLVCCCCCCCGCIYFFIVI